MDALTSAGRLFGPCDHEHRSVPGGSPGLLHPHFQPFCPQPPRHPSHGICARSRFASVRGRMPVNPALARGQREFFPPGLGQGLRSASAGSPVGAARIGFTLCHISNTLLRTGCSPPAAPHPVLPRRSSLRLQAGERFRLTGTFTPLGGRPHRRTLARLWRVAASCRGTK